MEKRTRKSRHSSKKQTKRLKISLAAGLVLILLLGSVFFVYQHLSSQQTVTASKKVVKHKKQVKPASTSSSSQSKPKPSQAPADPVLPGWIQIHSTGDAPKFTDLSKPNLAIVRAHNPQIFKTTSSKEAISHSLGTMMQQYPNTAIMNASYFGGGMSEGEASSPMGLQINNGQLFSDWPKAGTGMTSEGQVESVMGQATFVVNKNGTVAAYNATTPASQILANGAFMSFSFESILIQDGQVQAPTGSFDFYPHALIGNDNDNNIYLITCVGNYGYDNFMSDIAFLYLKTLVELDSGASSQMALQGKVLQASTYNRSVPDWVILK